ncbi:hypothetical protein [Armatimonas sp.]|uniref:hypothetical protein n=1 Tax=Armatimonas sp. TaxID=1872638 RepID=UPI00286BA9A9|nr:hypothetical protein [Armatimonas sp.]
MTTIEITQAHWQTIPGAKPLFEIYGYWPTLHDAIVRELKVGFTGRELTLVMDYSDLVLGRENEPNICTRITMRWFGITESTLRLHNGDLYGIGFTHANGFLETHFKDYCYGLDGAITAEGVEVIHIDLSPVRPDDQLIEITLG